ncbi:hypothetical protein [Paenibacillus agaridevorans]|uniref:hypothetical protein n=1 Tax=Paenibacillus agaridevorans TaxID=171404 RepID=UPI001BE46C89|nr:hypothetical protein [Paenibacillus agaridevorans]
MDNQRDKQYVPTPEGKYPRAELEGVPTYMGRDKRLEEMRRTTDVLLHLPGNTVAFSIEQVEWLLEEIDRLRKTKNNLRICQDCGFGFDACHTDDTPAGGYSCQLCEATKLSNEIERLQQEVTHAKTNRENAISTSKALHKDNTHLLGVVSQLKEERDRLQVERDKAVAELKRFANRDPYATGSSAKRVLLELGESHETT